MTSHQRSTGSVYLIYTIFVATKPSFRDHWKFLFVMTQQGTRCAMADQQMYGRANIVARRSQPRSQEYTQKMTLSGLQEWDTGFTPNFLFALTVNCIL